MIKGIYTAASGMITQYKKMDVVANNLANADTTAFKKDGVTTESFPELLTSILNEKTDMGTQNREIGKMSLGASLDKVYTDFSQGSIKTTHDSLNFAIKGDGFFTVSAMDESGSSKDMYTRDGSLVISKDGVLMTKNGEALQGEKGNITIPNGEMVIKDNGEIYVDSNYIDKIKLVDFEDKKMLRKVGDNLYDVANTSVKKKEFEGSVLQGALETSNINTVREMIEMINITRTYEVNQKVLQSNDSTLEKAVNIVGKL